MSVAETPGKTAVVTDEEDADKGAGPNGGAAVSDDAEDADFHAAFTEAATDKVPADDDGDKGEGDQAGKDADADRADKAPSGTSDKAPPAEGSADKAAPGEQEPDPLAGLSPELKKLFQDQQARIEKETKRSDGLARRLAGFSRTASATPPAKVKTDAEKETESEAQKVLNDEIARIEKDYPEIAGPIVALLKAQSARLDEVQARVEPITEASREDAQHAAIEALERQHDDFRNYGDPTDPKYDAWLKAQPAQAQADNKAYLDWLKTQAPGVVKLSKSWDPDDCSTVLTLFKLGRAEAKAKEPADAGDKADTDDATGDRRRRQLDGGALVTSKTADVASGVGDDFEAAFAVAAKKLTPTRK